MSNAWAKEEVFFESSGFFAHLERGLLAARKSVELETYIFEHDELGRRIAARLQEAAQRGVDVRVMVDGFGSPHWFRHFFEELTRAGVDVRVFHPLPLSFPFVFDFFRRLSTMNERNHRKVCIVDRYRAWTGGMNISAAHGHWRDTGIYIEGNRAQALLHAFRQTWAKAWSPKRTSGRRRRWYRFRHWVVSRLVRLNADRATRRTAYRELLLTIARARKRIWITNSYFVPTQKLLRALRKASERGVDVRVLVPEAPPGVTFIHWISSALYKGLLESGVRIFEYLSAPLHAKTMLVDEEVTIGTSNLNHRSIFHDLEVDIVLSSPDTVFALARQFETDLRSSREATLSDWSHRSILEKLGGQILLLFRHWL